VAGYYTNPQVAVSGGAVGACFGPVAVGTEGGGGALTTLRIAEPSREKGRRRDRGVYRVRQSAGGGRRGRRRGGRPEGGASLG